MRAVLERAVYLVSGRRGRHPVCLVCRGYVRPHDDRVRLRGGSPVHRRCATSDVRVLRRAADARRAR